MCCFARWVFREIHWQMSEHKQRWESPLGEILLSATDKALTGVWFLNQKYAPDSAEFRSEAKSSPVLACTIRWLDAYFASFGKSTSTVKGNPSCSLPKLAPKGSEFQQQVWQALGQIHSGDTPTYGQIAKSLGKPSAVRAVAAAIGRNPISILIPCHRVIGANGSLTGYAGGLDRKKALLAHEHLTDV